jgi:hypothetical protein
MHQPLYDSMDGGGGGQFIHKITRTAGRVSEQLLTRRVSIKKTHVNING